MFYCFPQELREKIVDSDSTGFIFFDEEKDCFLDLNHHVVDIVSKPVLIFDHIFGLFDSIDLVEEYGGIPVNSIEAIERIKHWTNEIEPYHRDILEIFGSDFEDLSFLTCLFERFGVNGSVFLKTLEKDFHGIIPITEIMDPDSAFRKTVKHFPGEQFLISPVISIDEDELGKKEYRVFVHNGKVTSISRPLHKTYHRIPSEVLEFANQVIGELPDNFPTYFVLDIAYSNHRLDIIEFNPIETSFPYLYNSRREIENPDLLHMDMTCIPNPKEGTIYSVELAENVSSPTFSDVPGSFAYEYQNESQKNFEFDPSVSTWCLFKKMEQ